MFPAERRQLISGLVSANGAVSLKELARATGSSEVTVRRDLRQLQAEGVVDRRHGGAVATAGTSHELSYSDKTRVAAAEKAAIAEIAAELVTPGDAIVVGAGTTTQALARRLVRVPELTVVTNSLLVAHALAQARSVEVILTGGLLRGSILAVVGSATEQALAGVLASRAFLSGNGLTAERGLSTPNATVAAVDRALAEAAREVVVLADCTKVGNEALVQTVPTARIHHVVTDEGADPACLAQLREEGVQVTVARLATAPLPGQAVKGGRARSAIDMP